MTVKKCMDNYLLKYKKHINHKGLLLGIAVAWGMVSMAAVWADTIASAPLFISTGVGPNILFILDDSTTMAESYLPEQLNIDYTFDPDPLVSSNALRSSVVNTLYYDPTITYTPPVDQNGASLGNATFTAAWKDGYASFPGHGGDVVDLSDNYRPTWSSATDYPFGGGQEAYYYLLKPTCTAAVDIYTRDACYTKTRVSHDELQNFANWYSYYRSRIMMAKAGISRAFAQLGTTPRVGYGRLSIATASTVDGVGVDTIVRGVRTFSGADRSAFFRWLFAIQPAINTTPSRRALDSAGLYYSNQASTGPWSSTPGSDGALLACRQSYTVFMTDGYWNGAAAGTVAAQANNDGSAGPAINGPDNPSFSYAPRSPFIDAYSNTLADVAMYYWKRDLCPSIANQVPTSTLDPAFWQHIVTYGIGLGVPTAVDPAAAFAAIGTGAAIAWPDPDTAHPATNSNTARIDDLLHAAVNSRGGFFNVNNPNELAAKLNATLSRITTASTGSAASVAANSTQLNTGTQVYQALFDPKDWSGKLQAFIVNSDGTLSPTPPAPPPPGWEASALLPALGASGRSIYTYNPVAAAGVLFQWANLASSPSGTSQQDYLNTLTGTNDSNGALRVNWLRGDQRQEQSAGGIFRNRTNLLGDIVNSTPVYVGSVDYGYGDLSGTEGSSYSTFLASSAYTGRRPMLYVGANDGMLHGFDAGNGQEKFAYIPNAVFPNLSALTSPTYSHQYYVDGVSGVGDVYDGSAWRTLLAGATGAGGRAVFALDVTDPATFNASNILWEYTNTTNADGTPNPDGSDLGYTLAQPSVVRLQNGTWAVIVANGYNSDNGHAVLFVLNALTGEVLQKIDTGVGTPSTPNDPDDPPPNGLSSPVAVDTDNDRSVDTVYAGDLYGNLWKFKFNSSTSSWEIPGNSPLFVACTAAPCTAANRQPITGKPNVGRVGVDQNGIGFMVYFGTGKYFEKNDNIVDNNSQAQTFYGLWDKGSAITDRSSLQEQTVTYEGSATLACAATSTCPTAATTTVNPVVVVSKNPVCYAATSTGCTASSPLKSGWALNLIDPGERVVSFPIIRQGFVLFTTLIPDPDPCKSGGTSHFMAVGALSGGESGTAPFGINGDSVVDSNDKVVINDVAHFASGMDLWIGIISTPTIIEGASVGYAYICGTSGQCAKPPLGSGGGSHRSWRQLK